MRKLYWVLAGLLALAPAMAAQPVMDPVGMVESELDQAKDTAHQLTPPVEALEQIWDVLDPQDDPEGADPAPPETGKDPDFSDRVATAFHDEVMAWGIGGAALAIASLGGFFAVTRYISPKEALGNPQRSMLYGFIRGNPGAHLKQLSEEFAMKTSSILWHIRKLESAELVKSERVGGYRVFYAVDGGIEIKRVSRAITSLQNANAKRIFTRIQRNPGSTTRQVSEALGLHGGTARWHLRKMRDAGLLDELVQDSGSKFYNTPLGDRAIETMEGTPTVAAPRRAPSAISD